MEKTAEALRHSWVWHSFPAPPAFEGQNLCRRRTSKPVTNTWPIPVLSFVLHQSTPRTAAVIVICICQPTSGTMIPDLANSPSTKSQSENARFSSRFDYLPSMNPGSLAVVSPAQWPASIFHDISWTAEKSLHTAVVSLPLPGTDMQG